VKAAGIARAPTWHDMRHSHVSRLFAVSAMPLPPTVLSVYAHQYSDARRRASESDELGALYDRGSAMEAPDANAAQQTADASRSESATSTGEAQRRAVGRNPSGILAKYVEKLLPSRIELP
jgi:hypothetical protein